MTAQAPDFVCTACGELRDFYSEAVIVGCKPDDAELWVTGLPCIFTGLCIICLGDDE